MLKFEGSTTHMETQQNEEVTDRIASTMNGNCDVIDENVSEEEKKRKKKTRRKNNSKITGSENGAGNEVGNFSGERMSLGQELSSEVAYLSLNYKVPREELEVYLNSNGMSAKLTNVDIPDQDQEDTANSLRPPKQKGSKKKEKK